MKSHECRLIEHLERFLRGHKLIIYDTKSNDLEHALDLFIIDFFIDVLTSFRRDKHRILCNSADLATRCCGAIIAYA